jgi:hypothetical protein
MTEQKWIPVSERLPNINQSALVYFDSGNMAVGFWYDVDFGQPLWETWTDDGWTTCADCAPTHWMPLPEPPKEDA